ncbi:aldehyde dehydrogenase family protein, partial [Staphylococcus aureus]
SCIAAPRHLARLQGLLDDAQARGARLLRSHDEQPDSAQDRRLVPTLLLDVTPEMSVMQQEIFGPLLPVLPYDRIED